MNTLAPGTPVTMKSIADEIGVSVTTVARALKGGERISPEMVRKVNETAERLGYMRNLDAVKLRTGQTFVVMTFLSFTSDEEIGDSGSVGLLNGIHKRLAATEYSVRAAPVTMEESGLEMIKKVVNGRNADGIILDHTTPQDERVKYLLDVGMPFVTFGRTDFSEQHAFFDLDNVFAAYQSTKAMLQKGYRRVALLDADKRYSFTTQRIEGYRQALEEAGLPLEPDLMRHIQMDPLDASKAATDLLRCGADAFVCVNELALLGARAGVRRELGASAEKIGYSLRSGTNLGAYLGSQVSSAFFSRTETGQALADLLLKRIAGTPVKKCQLVTRTELRDY
jgi:LacI family transcriptional regulator, galactose operon repressor